MDDDGDEWMDDLWRRISENDPNTDALEEDGDENYYIQTMTDENWEQLGHDIANNTHLTHVDLSLDALNDRKMSCFFRGLTRSSSIKEMALYRNHLSVAGVRSMVPFLQHANNLTHLNLDDNDLQSEGFNMLLRALRDSPIEMLYCCRCGIESIEIDIEHAPRHLKELSLHDNNIDADGCREAAKLLQGGDATLESLNFSRNNINDEGVEILVEALQSNKSLRELYLQKNGGISQRGKIMLLKLVNDISSIEATLRSNHTLRNIILIPSDADAQIHEKINMATAINRLPEEAGRMKVIETQLNSVKRAELVELQGDNQSIYSEINPLHLPEVLALVGRCHGQGELFVALKSSIAEVISTVDRKECIKQENSYYSAKIAEYRAKMEANEAELATIEASEASVVNFGSESRCNKRRKAS